MRIGPRPLCHALMDLSTKMADKHGMSAGSLGAGHGTGGSYTVTLDANPSVEQVQSYTTKPLTPTNYVPSSREFDFMSSFPSGSPTGTL